MCNKSRVKSIREGSERAGGALSYSILPIKVLDSNDFNSIPRSGNEKDFFYRVSLFEKLAKSLSSRMLHLNHGLGIGAAVGVAGWQEQIVGLYVMQRHGVSSNHRLMQQKNRLNHGIVIGAAVELTS